MIDPNAKTYENAIEDLVERAVERQLKQLPEKLAAYIDRTQVSTYALNRLPPLYASSEEGKALQIDRAREELRDRIQAAVRQGLAAVRRDPLKSGTPLVEETVDPDALDEYESASKTLQRLRNFLERPDMEWQDLIPALEQTFDANSQKELKRQLRYRSIRKRAETVGAGETNTPWDKTYLR